MENLWLIALVILIFTLIIFLYWKMTIGSFKKEYGEKRRKLWGQNTFYWQSVIYGSTGITILILFILKWANVLTF